jgi:predicted DNA-binding WGR domain protein
MREYLMADETSYLELSEENGGAHKFYEVATSDTQVQIRYGRIGDQGQTQSSTSYYGRTGSKICTEENS